MPAHVIGGGFSGRAHNDWRCCFSSWGMFLYEGAYWGSNGAGCLARTSDAQDSDANWWKEDDVDALSGAGEFELSECHPKYEEGGKRTVCSVSCSCSLPPAWPSCRFLPLAWTTNDTVQARFGRRCPGRRTDGASGTANHAQATRLFSGLARFWLFAPSLPLPFHAFPFPSPSSAAPLLPPWHCVLPIIALCQHFPSLTLPFGLHSLSTAPSPSPSPSFDRTTLSFRNAHTEETRSCIHSIPFHRRRREENPRNDRRLTNDLLRLTNSTHKSLSSRIRGGSLTFLRVFQHHRSSPFTHTIPSQRCFHGSSYASSPSWSSSSPSHKPTGSTRIPSVVRSLRRRIC